MTQLLRTFGYGVTLAAIFALILISGGAANAQQDPAQEQLLSPEQLDDLVAPIALYPDPLISQVLVASTYPLEIVEASQWLQRNPNVSGTALTQAAVKQDWDPSIQALVVFPDVLKYLMEDIAWTTNLGNAFLAQEGDVMDAIQRMRERAARLGKLVTTPEQQVIHVIDNGQPVYEIVPTNPTVIYVPVYDPYYIWGSALYYPYPRWYYPPYANHVYFNRGIYIDAYYGSGWYGSISYGPTYRAWNSWGWRPAWNNRTVVVNNVFIDNHYHNASRPRNVSGTTASWSHDASHRRGVVYPNTASYDRYRRDPRDVPRPQLAQGQNRNVPAQVATRSAGTSNNSRQLDTRQGGRADSRLDSRQDARPDTRQDTRPDTRQDARTDTRVAGRDSTPNSPNRDNRADSNSRNDRGNSNVNTTRSAPAPAQVASSLPTHVTPAQVTLERQARQAAVQSQDVSRQRGPAQEQQNSRENRQTQNAGTSITRQSQGQSRETPSVRSSAPSVSQVSTVRQSSPSRTAAPEVRSSPAQQQTRSSISQGSQGAQRSQPAQMAQTSPRQSAPDRGVSSESRRAPASQAAPSSNGQSGRSSNGGGNGNSSNGGGSNGGGNSKGRR